jgi:hypothetical protein
MTTQKPLIDKYVLVLLEFIHLINTSDIIRSLDNAHSVYKIGLNAVTHIFKLSYYITHNSETAGCYSQKGIYCYLEYIEQMNRTHTLHNLNNIDAVLFVYDKTLSEIYSPTGNNMNISSHEQNMFTNIVSLNHPQMYESNVKPLLENISSITHTILWIENPKLTYLQQLDITHEYLPKYIALYEEVVSPIQPDTQKQTLNILQIISIIQDKIQLEYAEYVDFLEMFYKMYRKTLKQSKLPENIDEKCLYITIYLANIPLSGITSCEFGKMNGWKTPLDFVKWIFM